jgi:CheY-like chemotaxis protein
MERLPKILLIDDDPDFVEATSRVLKARPYQISVAYDGAAGLRKVKEETPDIILLDIMMPEKDGYVVADELSRDPAASDIPILALTSFTESLGPAPFPFKVSEYLQKSVKPEELIGTIEKHLKRLGLAT